MLARNLDLHRNKPGVSRPKRYRRGDPRLIAWLRAHFHDNDIDAAAVGRVALNAPTAINSWLYGRNILQVEKMEAVLNTLGYQLEVVPMRDEPRMQPAVPIEESVTDDFIVCLEDGKKFKSMKRHLQLAFGMTPDEYRAKWKLQPDYPMIAPGYAARLSRHAREIGLGQAIGRKLSQ